MGWPPRLRALSCAPIMRGAKFVTFCGVSLRSAATAIWHAKSKTIFPRRAPAAQKNFFRRPAAANSMYPADRARFGVRIDMLFRSSAKTPLTSVLADIKSATRPVACCASPDKWQAQRRTSREDCGNERQPGAVEMRFGRKNWPGLGGVEAGHGPSRWPALSVVRASFS